MYLPRFVDNLESILTRFSMASLFLMMLIVVADVFGRFFFNSPIAGGKELVEFSMIFLVYFGLSYTQGRGGHVGMDAFIDSINNKRKLRLSVRAVNYFISVLVAGILVFFSFNHAVSVYSRGVLSIYLQWPMWIMSVGMFIGVLVLLMRLLCDFFYSPEKTV